MKKINFMVRLNRKQDPNFMFWGAISFNNILNLKNLFRGATKKIIFFNFLSFYCKEKMIKTKEK